MNMSGRDWKFFFFGILMGGLSVWATVIVALLITI